MLKIGVIGCGTIGTELCKAIDKKVINARLEAIYDRSTENCEKLKRLLKNKPEIMQPDELISGSDIVVECASISAVQEFGAAVLERGKDIMILSVGALADENLLEKLMREATSNNCRIYIPSGAITGIDGMKSANIVNIKKVVLTTTKNPNGLRGAQYVIENHIDLLSFHEKTLLFEGSAKEAIEAFPANVNIAVSLSLAGIGTEDTRVRVFVDPNATRNIHEIYVEGAFGNFTCRIENVPSPDNPGTSYLAALSAIATLKKITEPLQIGT